MMGHMLDECGYGKRRRRHRPRRHGLRESPRVARSARRFRLWIIGCALVLAACSFGDDTAALFALGNKYDLRCDRVASRLLGPSVEATSNQDALTGPRRIQGFSGGEILAAHFGGPSVCHPKVRWGAATNSELSRSALDEALSRFRSQSSR